MTQVSELLTEVKKNLERGEIEAARATVSRLKSRSDLSEEESFKCSIYESRIHTKLGAFNDADKIVQSILQTEQIRTHENLLISALVVQAELAWRQGNITEGLEVVQVCENLLSKIGDSVPAEQRVELREREAELFQHAGILCWYAGALDRALNYQHDCLDINQELVDARGVSNALNNIGLVLVSKGDFEPALENYHRALAIKEETGDEEGIAKCLNNIGVVYTNQGDLDQALAYFQQSLSISEKAGNRRDVVLRLINIGAIYQYKGGLTSALEHFQKAVEMSEEMDLKKEVPLALNNLAGIHETRGDLKLAFAYLQRSLTLYQEAGMKQEMALALLNLGGLFREKGDFEDSLEYLRRSLKIYEELENKPFIVIVLHGLVELAYNLSDSEMGWHFLHRMESIKKQFNNKVVEQRCLVAKALLLKQSKRMQDKVNALEMLEKVVSDEIVDHALFVDATVHLCDLLLAELKMTGEEELFTRIKSLTGQLLNSATEQGSHILLAKTYLLQSKLALVELDMTAAQDYLDKAGTIAKEKELNLLAFTISQEHDGLQVLMKKWAEILQQKPSKQEMIDVSGIDNLLERMIQKTVSDILKERGVSEPDSSRRKYQLVYLDSLEKSEMREKQKCRVGIAQIGLSASGDIFNEFYSELNPGIFGLRNEKEKNVENNLVKMVKTAARMEVDLLIFPELSVDLSRSRLFDLVLTLARDYHMHVIPGSYHDLDSKQNISVVISPEGVLWRQEKHIPAVISIGNRRVAEGITKRSSAHDIVIGSTPFGRIAIVICRDFLDMDLRVALKHADPPVDLIINPAFTPVTADFRAAHFDARRSIYAYCFFANIAEFGDSLIYTPEKERIERNIPEREENIITKDIDLFRLRSERKTWEKEQLEQRSFIQSTR